MILSPSLAAFLLGEAYAGAIGQRSRLRDWELGALARALDADSDLLEAAWSLWTWEMDSWSEAAILEARYWLDAVLIGGLPIPD